MADFKSRFVFSITETTKNQLDAISKDQECSAAAMIRRLIKEEYLKTLPPAIDVKQNEQ